MLSVVSLLVWVLLPSHTTVVSFLDMICPINSLFNISQNNRVFWFTKIINKKLLTSLVEKNILFKYNFAGLKNQSIIKLLTIIFLIIDIAKCLNKEP